MPSEIRPPSESRPPSTETAVGDSHRIEESRSEESNEYCSPGVHRSMQSSSSSPTCCRRGRFSGDFGQNPASICEGALVSCNQTRR